MQPCTLHTSQEHSHSKLVLAWCAALRCTALHCSALRCAALECTALQRHDVISEPSLKLKGTGRYIDSICVKEYSLLGCNPI
jgi:hypothetical protein